MITAFAFILGFSVTCGLQKIGQILAAYWNGGTAATAKKVERVSFAREPKVYTHPALNKFTGKYYLSEEQFPEGFTDFDHLEIKTQTYSETAIPPKGRVQTSRTFEFRSISINRDLLVFETEERGGIRYRFSGTVLQTVAKTGIIKAGGVGDIAGKLEKLRNGETVASMETTFYLFGS